HWKLIPLMVLCGVAMIMCAPDLGRRLNVSMPKTMQQMIHRRISWRHPRVLRMLAVGGMSLKLAELIRCGIPMVEALRVLSPTVTHRGLRETLIAAADRVESGDDLSSALIDHDDRWFDAEFLRLLDIGQVSGELDVMLERIGERYERQAHRWMDRL